MILPFVCLEYHLCLVFVCLGHMILIYVINDTICMFGSIIYVLYLYVWEYHLCLVFLCLQDINDTPKHTNTRHKCLVFVCLGVSFMISHLYVYKYHL